MSEKVQISLRSVIEDLNNGVTRCKGDTGYSEERGSIQEKYGLNKSQVREMFKHPQLKNIRVRVPVEPAFELIEDVEEGENLGGAHYGERSASSLARAEAAESNEVPSEEQTSGDIPEEMI